MSKKLVQINVVCNGSTGRIMNYIQQIAQNEDFEAFSFYGRGKKTNNNCFKIDYKIEIIWHYIISRLFNLQGHGSIFATYRMIRKIKKINPDIIHLHNLHGYYINYRILFDFLKKYNKKIVWTLHDCWAFTGHCCYYTSKKCDKWKKQCEGCNCIESYPKAIFGNKRVKTEFNEKKKLINDLNNVTLVTPSKWLKEQVKESFLKNKDIEIIHNCIDTNVFKYSYDSSLRKKYGINNKKIILGVAAQWGKNKGLEYFKKLSEIIDNDKEVIMMIGLTDKQINEIPDNIIGIKRTEDIEELVKLYSIADVFFNPSIQETFSMVTLESMACGTPCLVFNSTATPELINEKIGKIINDFDIENIKSIYNDIKTFIYNEKNANLCIEHANKYNMNGYKKYIYLYNKLLKEDI